MKRFLVACAALLLSASAALAQSSPGLTTGQVPSAVQWNGYFAAKQDVIANGSFGNAKLAPMANLTVKANASGSSTSPSDIAVSALLDAAFSSTRGSILYRGAGGWAPLGPGSSGQILQSQGSTADPGWFTAGTGGVSSVTCFGTVITASGICTTKGQIPGTATNDTASAGNVGEELTNSVEAGSAVAISNGGVTLNVTAISLSAGDWDLSANGQIISPNGQTHSTSGCSISANSGSFDSAAARSHLLSIPFTGNGGANSYPIPKIRVSVASSATYYLVCFLNATTANGNAYGSISKRRVR